MRIYRNLTQIKKKESLGRRFSLAGLAILFVGLLASFVPTWLPPDQPIQAGFTGFLQMYWSWISFVALAIGFMLASAGSYYINRYARRRWPGSRFFERPDEVLERSMKGFDDKYSYFALSLPVSYVLAGPNGVTVFAVRSDKGRVIVEGDKWREPFSFGRLFTIFSREGVGNPAQELEDHKQKIRALLAQTPDGESGTNPLASVPIDGAALFLNQSIELEMNNPTVPVLRADQLKDHLRARAKEAKLSNATIRALSERLAEQATYQAAVEE
jgi:MFS family permease